MTKPEMKVGARNSARDAKNLQQIHDLSVSNGATCARARMTSVGKSILFARVKAAKALADVYVETWDITNACQVLSGIAQLISSEASQGEPNDVAELAELAQGVIEFIAGELIEINADIASDPAFIPDTEENEAVDIPAADEMMPADMAMMSAAKSASDKPGDYLVVEDPKKTSTYHLQVRTDGKPDHGLMGSAWAALHGGFRGNTYDGPDKQKAIDKLTALYKQEKMDLPGAKSIGMNLTYIKRLHMSQDEEYFRDVLAVKSAGKDGLHGYLALWGQDQLTDLETDFFTGKAQKGVALLPTDFWDEYLPLPKPLTWDHAQDPVTKASPVMGYIEEVGDDEIGRWYNAQRDTGFKYRKAVDKLISNRDLGTSSDSVPQYVIRERTKSGANWLKRWPMIGAALTPTPCEPRMFDAGSLHWKSIGFDPALLARTGEAHDAAVDAARLADLTRKHDELMNVLSK